MQKMQNDFFRNNHHSLNRKQSPFSLQGSKAQSVTKLRKMSSVSLKQNIPDLQKLIMDIKISPATDTASDNIKQIYSALKKLQNNAKVADQVNAVYLLMQSIQNKLSCTNRQKYRPPKLILKKDQNASQVKELCQVSPIKQINQDTGSRILYTNFSLKDIEKTASQQNSIVQSNKGSATKIAISKFQQSQHNEEVDNLNEQIKYLQKLLASKTKGASVATDLASFKKKSYRY